jgi:hypothetical protein
MLFYGDVARTPQPSSVRRSISEKLEVVLAAAPGRRRHEELVRAFIEAGELVQGLVDEEFDATGTDDLSQIHKDGLSFLLVLAGAIKASWESGFTRDLGAGSGWHVMLDRLDGQLPLGLKRAEGYAFYCLYPENYLEAAHRSGLASNTVVIGLRSIGVGLAALVASAVGTRRVFTLRPTGHPFDRRLAISAALTQKILKDRSADFALVDEGPGMSGSSFGCAADWLIAHGVAPRRIHFFPSHDGELGAHSSAVHRARWAALPRHVTSFDRVFIERHAPFSLQGWVSKLAGEPVQEWKDVSGGSWRALHYPRRDTWPAVHTSMEKRKFLMRSEDRGWLVKFAGLDDLALRRLKASATMAEAGFVPPHKGAVYGFLVEEWVSAKPPDIAAFNNNDDDDVVDHVGRYLGFRARHLAPPLGGASLTDLCAMAVFNVGEALGADLAHVLMKRIGNIGRVESRLRRTDTDNRMHRWEWLVTPAGDMLKTDAIDHNAAHDFVGCQDISWDIAGAAVEFALSDGQRRRLADRAAILADYEPHDDTLRIFEYCYLAFQIGLWTYAHSAANQEEAPRIEYTLKRYLDRVRLLLVDR